MGHYQQWNMKLDEVIELAHLNIKTILKENKEPILLSKLVTLLNNKTKNIKFHQNKKMNHFSKYMKHNYGGLLKFLDDYNIYGIIDYKSDKKIVLLDDNNSKIVQFSNDNEWILL